MIPALSRFTVQCNELYPRCLGTFLEGCTERASQAMIFLRQKHATPSIGAERRGVMVHLWQALPKPVLLGQKI